ncbi:Pantoate-beta-alanine ligase [Gorgonomyces haynaldii]|nr:Pantoate-beta-alanine ligase [Gorgonomyces haynaldii]
MGALHQGHISLVQQARRECDIVVASIFVNPAQFAPTEDLAKYPRTEEQDTQMLRDAKADVVLMPPVEEMYPSGITLDVSKQVGTFVSVQGKSHQMEGSIRPHFFRGVATVVSKLFNMAQPTKAYFGQKDVQQCSVIRSMVRDLLFPIEVVVGETVRETDGLAMSSRNRYLNKEERKAAPVLYKAMAAAEKAYNSGVRDRKKLVELMDQIIAQEPICEKQYWSIADPVELKEVNEIGPDGAILSGAILVGKTRIIDNILLGLSRQKL